MRLPLFLFIAVFFAQSASAEVKVTQTVAPTLRHAVITATASADHTGEILHVVRGRERLNSIVLAAGETGAVGKLRFMLPLVVNQDTPNTVVRHRAKLIADLPTPNTLDRRIAAFMEVPFHSHSMFAGTELPEPEFEHPGWVETLFGPHKITARFFNNDHEEVTKAEVPGRYGVVTTLHAEGIKPIHRFVTIYRVPKRLDWGAYRATLTAPESVGVNPAVLEAAQEQLNDMVRWELVDRFEHKLHGAAFFGAMAAATVDDAPFTGANAYWNADEAWWIALKKKIGLFEHRYLTYLPDGYEVDTDQRWPLLIYLHGPQEAGTDLDRVKQNALPKLLEQGKKVPMIVIAPQLEAEKWWVPAHVNDLVDELVQKYRVDADRIYLSGIMMGGFSSWYTAGFYPDRFAAIVPVRAGGDPSLAPALKTVSAWAFHAEKDPGVPISRNRRMVNAVNKAGGNAKLTAIPGDNERIYNQVYQREDIWPWLLKQSRGKAN